MDIKWQKWKTQLWKSPPIWDPVILPRPFTDSDIQYMECFESIFVLILSNKTNIEIWNIKTGSMEYHFSFHNFVECIDYCGLYQHNLEGIFDDIENWTIFIINENGFLGFKACNSLESDIIKCETRCNLIKKCFFTLIGDIKSIILTDNYISIINCFDLTTLVHVPDLMEKEIQCILVTSDNIVASSDQNLTVYQLTVSDSFHFELNLIKKLDSHKNKIQSLMEIGENYLASISCEAVKIWKKPDFNITRMFKTWEDIGQPNEKEILCLLYNSRYLTVALNNNFVIFDCISGSTMAKVSDAHDSKIIGLAYFTWLSMLFTVSEDGISRFWAFQMSGNLNDTIKIRSTSPMSKSMIFPNYFTFSRTKSMEEKPFLGKSLEKCDRECHQTSCFLEFKYSIKSKNHFVNLEEIGLLTSDGTSNLLMWRNRDYLINGLLKLLHN